MKSIRRALTTAAGAIVLLGIATGQTRAQCQGTELERLIASDGGPGESFGRSVSLDGSTALIGSPGFNAPSKGAAYIFTHDGVNWVQGPKLAASDGLLDDLFGFCVSLDGDVAVVGAFRPGEPAVPGKAYVFRRAGQDWFQEQILTPADTAPGDRFGISVSVSGNAIIVGAELNDACDVDPDCNSGAAYIFRYDGTAWVQEQKLSASDASADDLFGGDQGVAIDGDVAVVGATNKAGDATGQGAAYVFRFDGADWIEEQKLLASDAQQNDRFGYGVALDGDVILVGARLDDDLGSASGAAYVFRRDGSVWTQEQKLHSPDPQQTAAFGASVSIDGNVAVVSSRLSDEGAPDSGSAHVFTYDGAAWTAAATILPSDPAQSGNFGWSVSVHRSQVLVGAPSFQGSGASYTFGGLGDCNSNGPLDLCDIADGTSRDMGHDGTPDECAACYPDLDASGALDLMDFLAFVNAFNAGDHQANCDGQGALDLFDFLCFVNAFSAGC